MAIGEWVSVQSSRELNRRQIGIEAEEVATAPEEEAEELALIYETKGLTQSDAEKLARRLIAEPKSALETLSREELGIDPNELGASPWVAAAMSFGLSIHGAIFPVAPFAFLQGKHRGDGQPGNQLGCILFDRGGTYNLYRIGSVVFGCQSIGVGAGLLRQ